MIFIVGLLAVLFCVFGGYAMHGGHMEVILHALPFEMLVIGGSALAGLSMGAGGVLLKGILKNLKKTITGSKWKKQDFFDLLCLMFILCKTMKTKGDIAVESHVEKPSESAIFKQFPRILADHHATDLIADSLRLVTMGAKESYELEEVVETNLATEHEETSAVAGALQSMADALPAIGIVAAVLGVIKTMGSITEPPEILGGMIGSALVGTFLGVFLAYLLVGPMAQRLKSVFAEEHRFGVIIQKILVAHLTGKAPIISVEIGRAAVPSHLRPSFSELEEATNKAEQTAKASGAMT